MSANKTGYFSHPSCRRHEMGPGHPECPERLAAIDDRLLATGVADALDRREAPSASQADLELAHDRLHVAAMRGLVEALEEEIAAGGPAYAAIDPDTVLNPHTWDAALHAAGAALAATDAVIAGQLENAFCSVRPPGHHACRDRAMGFCFFNNVAIAARYALERHGLKRVAIVDFDVHHGNGTQACLESDPTVLFISLHQDPRTSYPGSGHAYETGEGAGEGFTINLPLQPGSDDEDYLRTIDQRVVPALNEFRPEVLLMSAGFDAHVEDPLAQMNVSEEGFEQITRRLVAVADQHCNGRVVSVLEGGYNLRALGRSVVRHLIALS